VNGTRLMPSESADNFLTDLIVSGVARGNCLLHTFGQKILSKTLCSKVQNLGPNSTPHFVKFKDRIKILSTIISCVRNLRISVGKWQLGAPLSFFTPDAAGHRQRGHQSTSPHLF